MTLTFTNSVNTHTQEGCFWDRSYPDSCVRRGPAWTHRSRCTCSCQVCWCIHGRSLRCSRSHTRPCLKEKGGCVNLFWFVFTSLGCLCCRGLLLKGRLHFLNIVPSQWGCHSIQIVKLKLIWLWFIFSMLNFPPTHYFEEFLAVNGTFLVLKEGKEMV